MEMTILGSRHFLLFPSQIQLLSPKLRSCVVEKSLGYVHRLFILNFNDFWKSVVMEIITPPEIISCPAYSCFNSSTFQRPKKFLMEIARRKIFGFETSRALVFQIDSSQLGSPNFSQFHSLLPSSLFYFYLLETLEPRPVAEDFVLWLLFQECPLPVNLHLPPIFPEIACSTENRQ